MRHNKRLLPLLLTLVMILALIPAFGITALADNSGPKDLLILGDSISTGYGLANPAADSYGAQLAAAFGLTAPAYDNEAVDGATSGDLAAALQVPSAEALLAAHDTIAITIGGNDVLGPFFLLAKQAMGLDPAATNEELQAAIADNPDAVNIISGALLANQSQFTQAAAALTANLTAIVTAIKTANPGAQIYIQTIYNPFSGVPGLGLLPTAADTIFTQLNAVITGGAEAGGYTAVDIAAAFDGKAAELTNIASLDVHPNAAGQAVIYQEMYDAIAQQEAAPPASDNPFTDVKTGDWFYGDVMFVYSSKLMAGTSEDQFSPQMPLSRAMIATILYRAVGSPDVSSLPNPFSDVPDGQYYTDAVKFAAANEIVNGYGDGIFGPNDSVTREQLAAIFLRFATLEGKGPVGTWAIRLDFTDVGSISDWALDGVMFCVMNGVVNGYPDGSFNPQGTATRAEVAKMIHGIMEAIG